MFTFNLLIKQNIDFVVLYIFWITNKEIMNTKNRYCTFKIVLLLVNYHECRVTKDYLVFIVFECNLFRGGGGGDEDPKSRIPPRFMAKIPNPACIFSEIPIPPSIFHRSLAIIQL